MSEVFPKLTTCLLTFIWLWFHPPIYPFINYMWINTKVWFVEKYVLLIQFFNGNFEKFLVSESLYNKFLLESANILRTMIWTNLSSSLIFPIIPSSHIPLTSSSVTLCLKSVQRTGHTQTEPQSSSYSPAGSSSTSLGSSPENDPPCNEPATKSQ